MDVPILYIDKAGLGLVMSIVCRAFNNIVALACHGNNRAGATNFTVFAVNRSWNIYIALHSIIYAVLLHAVVGLSGILVTVRLTYFASFTSIQNPSGSVK